MLVLMQFLKQWVRLSPETLARKGTATMSDIRLSEAIREGAKIRPQSFVSFFEVMDGCTLGSCALGAAVEAVRGAPVPDHAVHYQLPDFIQDNFARVNEVVNCPIEGCPHQPVELMYMIMELNDAHYWTREQIADWLESLGY
jgi:hypothetical protein